MTLDDYMSEMENKSPGMKASIKHKALILMREEQIRVDLRAAMTDLHKKEATDEEIDAANSFILSLIDPDFLDPQNLYLSYVDFTGKDYTEQPEK